MAEDKTAEGLAQKRTKEEDTQYIEDIVEFQQRSAVDEGSQKGGKPCEDHSEAEEVEHELPDSLQLQVDRSWTAVYLYSCILVLSEEAEGEDEQQQKDPSGDEVHGREVHVGEVEVVARGGVVELVGDGGGQKHVEPGQIDGHEPQAKIDILRIGRKHHQRKTFQGQDVTHYLTVSAVHLQTGGSGQSVEEEEGDDDVAEEGEVGAVGLVDVGHVEGGVVEVVAEGEVGGEENGREDGVYYGFGER